MTDVLLRQTPDGGNLFLEGGLFLLSDGLEAAAYLSLFGSNEQDPGDTDSDQEWWGNLGVVDKASTYRSETQFLIKSLPAVPNSLKRIEEAALRDLSWMIEKALINSLSVVASIPALNRVVVTVTLVTLTQHVELSFG